MTDPVLPVAVEDALQQQEVVDACTDERDVLEVLELEEDRHDKYTYTYTMDGSVDRHGRPSVKGKTGGWSVGILLLVNQGLTSLAVFGVGVNLVLFMTRVLRQDNAEAANNVSKWTGTANLFSLVGAFLSDSYWGRYRTCVIFQFIFVAGLILLSLSSYLLLLRPCIPGDGTPNCEPPTSIEIAIFYLAIYQIALGNGGYQPAVTTFGADQFDEEDPKEGHSKVAFFSYFYMAMNLGTLFSNTVLVYVEDRGNWVLGFWLSSGSALLALLMFLAGAPWYRHFKPGGNPISRISQVVVASARKWKIRVPQPQNGETNLYEVDVKECRINGGRRILHTPDFRFLDRAAVVTPEDSANEEDQSDNSNNQHPNPWHLCTITQVEEVKCILRLLPIWLCTIMYSAVYAQMASVFIEQGAAMRTSISSFDIPPASMSIFEIFSVSGMVVVYRLYLVPLFCKLKVGNSKGLTELQRMGVGLVLSALGMVSAGMVESQRLKHAKNNNDNGGSSLSIVWQIPPYVLVGASEVFMYVGQLEFFNKQAPDGLKSFGSALYVASMALGNYVSSLLVTIVMQATARGGREGWIPGNLNRGHMDNFYFLLAALTGIDFIVFITCAKWYRCILLEGKDGSTRVRVGNTINH